MVASFYVDEDEGFIKFGSFDALGIAPNEKLVMVKTGNIRDWTLLMLPPKISGTKFGKAATQKLIVNPAYPHVYV